MPLYPHRCKKHGTYEVMTTRISDPIDPSCPVCGRAGERLLGVFHCKTETTFFKGATFGLDQFETPETQSFYGAAARKAGVSTQGKIYMSGLARYPGDPRAWVSSLHEAKKVCRQEGWGCERLGIKAEDRKEFKPGPAIAEDIVTDELNAMVERKEIHASEVEKKRDEVRDRLTPSWRKPGATAKPIAKPKRPRKSRAN